MKEKKSVKIICVLLLAIFIMTSCQFANVQVEEKTSNADKVHTHNFKYGYCQQCGEINENEKTNLEITIKAWFGLYLGLNYSSLKFDVSEDIEIEIKSISTDEDNYFVECIGYLYYAGKKYQSNIKYEGQWEEDSQFQKKNIVISKPTL